MNSKTEMITARIDSETKSAFVQICDTLGLSTSQAIKLFAKAVVNYGGIPFEMKAPQPNEVTKQAMQAAQRIRKPNRQTTRKRCAICHTSARGEYLLAA